MASKKRNIIATKRAAFWPCGSCRLICTSDCILCDSCKQWNHSKCAQLSGEKMNVFYENDKVPYVCNSCFMLEIRTLANNYTDGLCRLAQMSPLSLYGKQIIPFEFVEIDRNAQKIMNKCGLSSFGVPSLTTDDGNCLFNSVSIALTGSEVVGIRTELMGYVPTYDESLISCCTDGGYSSIWTIMVLSAVVVLPI
ncbi:hypothetical protein ACJMK2_019217 [Sinanodonta woodiana]|uniref:Zinc finger PHD-type domain-containing protein n=1 Tax=Sinanodonta woodiana TaxID=1069815 RepID=A0ABD3UFP3_SINWO